MFQAKKLIMKSSFEHNRTWTVILLNVLVRPASFVAKPPVIILRLNLGAKEIVCNAIQEAPAVKAEIVFNIFQNALI